MPRAPKGASTAAKRALVWVEAGFGGDNLTRVGLARANQLANDENISDETIQRMRSFFARHGNYRSTKWEIKDGAPTPWRVAWDLWGGDAGRDWVTQERFDK
jgi:hypothetical protein